LTHSTTNCASSSSPAMQRSLSAAVSALQRLDLVHVEAAVSILLGAYDRNATVACIGNGGSASTAAHFAADLGKFATGNALGFRALDLPSNYAAHTAWTNDSSWESTWEMMLRPWLRQGDVVVAFSVHGGSGWSSNLTRALEFARSAGAKTIGFAGDGGGLFKELCDATIIVPNPPQDLVTPITEGLHSVIAHLICSELRSRISS
jgi:D-sedoheptulose 7-phosphate isomerase